MPPVYAKAYVKRGKTDAADAEAIAEAATRPTMRFVAAKSEERQAALMLHKTRDLLIRQRAMLINALRGHLYEFGGVAPKGAAGATKAVAVVSDDTEKLPALARASLRALADQLATLAAEIAGLERRILARHRADETSRRLGAIPGVGPIPATASAAAARGSPR